MPKKKVWKKKLALSLITDLPFGMRTPWPQVFQMQISYPLPSSCTIQITFFFLIIQFAIKTPNPVDFFMGSLFFVYQKLIDSLIKSWVKSAPLDWKVSYNPIQAVFTFYDRFEWKSPQIVLNFLNKLFLEYLNGWTAIYTVRSRVLYVHSLVLLFCTERFTKVIGKSFIRIFFIGDCFMFLLYFVTFR